MNEDKSISRTILIEVLNITKLTVGELAESANINRTTLVSVYHKQNKEFSSKVCLKLLKYIKENYNKKVFYKMIIDVLNCI